jgi:hypothetical protein
LCVRLFTLVLAVGVVTVPSCGAPTTPVGARQGATPATGHAAAAATGSAATASATTDPAIERPDAREAREQAAALAKLTELYGHDVATMGALFGNVTLGSDAASFDAKAAAEHLQGDEDAATFDVTFDVVAGQLAAVKLSPYTYPAGQCPALEHMLVTAWGAAIDDSSGGGIWLGADHRRAAFARLSNGCELRFDRYASPTEWVAALPFDAIGKPARPFLAARRGATTQAMGKVEHATWQGPGVGAGLGPTEYEAYIVKGHVVMITATVSWLEDDHVRDALTKKLKAPPTITESDHGPELHWKRPVPIVLEDEAGPVVVIGTRPDLF